MSQNIEIKAAVSDLNCIRSRVMELSAEYVGKIPQHDTFFLVPFGKLKVRRFENKDTELILYYRGISRGPKKSKYYRVKVEGRARNMLRPIGKIWPKRGDVVKTRELFMFGDTRIHLDRIEKLGTYLEFEVVLESGDEHSVSYGIEKAEYLLDALGIEKKNLVETSYIDLLEKAKSENYNSGKKATKYNNANSLGRQKAPLRFAFWRR